MIAATLSPILGLMCSLIAWLVTAQEEYGDLSVTSTGSNNPMLAGNVVALLSPLIFVPVLTYAFGTQKYDWVSMAMIRLGDDSDVAAMANVDLELIPGAADVDEEELLAEKTKLKRSSFVAKTMTVILSLVLLVVSLPLDRAKQRKWSVGFASYHDNCLIQRALNVQTQAETVTSYGQCLCMVLAMSLAKSSSRDGCLSASYGCSAALSASACTPYGKGDTARRTRLEESLGICLGKGSRQYKEGRGSSMRDPVKTKRCRQGRRIEKRRRRW